MPVRGQKHVCREAQQSTTPSEVEVCFLQHPLCSHTFLHSQLSWGCFYDMLAVLEASSSFPAIGIL